jgi:hypothetical protein
MSEKTRMISFERGHVVGLGNGVFRYRVKRTFSPVPDVELPMSDLEHDPDERHLLAVGAIVEHEVYRKDGARCSVVHVVEPTLEERWDDVLRGIPEEARETLVKFRAFLAAERDAKDRLEFKTDTTMRIQQDFRAVDPDRIALVFNRDIAKEKP